MDMNEYSNKPRLLATTDSCSANCALFVSRGLRLVAVVFLGFGIAWGAQSERAEKKQDQLLADLVADPNSPVKYDVRLQEYQLVYSFDKDGKHMKRKVPLRFSPFTGEPLVSGRSAVFVEPAANDLQQIREKLHGARSLKDVEEKLGPPDLVSHNVDPFKTQYLYTNVTQTLRVIIQEAPDGKLTIATLPKEKPR